MIKLYRERRRGIEYWEAWPDADGAGTATVHQGRLGDAGTSESVACGADFEAWAARQARKRERAGFRALADDEHDVVLVKWPPSVAPDPDTVEAVWDELELLVNEALGWTGLGRCTGMDYSGEMTAMALAVDADAAVAVLSRALADAGRAEGVVIAVREDDRDVVRWPPERAGESLDP